MHKTKQNKQHDHPLKIGRKKKGKEKKIVYQFGFLEIKQNQLMSVITHPKYVTWLNICIDLITKVKGLRRKLNLFKHTLCFTFFKKYRIYISLFFFKFENSFAKSEMQSANSNPDILFKTLFICKNIFNIWCIELLYNRSCTKAKLLIWKINKILIVQ